MAVDPTQQATPGGPSAQPETHAAVAAPVVSPQVATTSPAEQAALPTAPQPAGTTNQNQTAQQAGPRLQKTAPGQNQPAPVDTSVGLLSNALFTPMAVDGYFPLLATGAIKLNSAVNAATASPRAAPVATAPGTATQFAPNSTMQLSMAQPAAPNNLPQPVAPQTKPAASSNPAANSTLPGPRAPVVAGDVPFAVPGLGINSPIVAQQGPIAAKPAPAAQPGPRAPVVTGDVPFAVPGLSITTGAIAVAGSAQANPASPQKTAPTPAGATTVQPNATAQANNSSIATAPMAQGQPNIAMRSAPAPVATPEPRQTNLPPLTVHPVAQPQANIVPASAPAPQLTALQQQHINQMAAWMKPQDKAAFQANMTSLFANQPQFAEQLYANMQKKFAPVANQPISPLQRNAFVNSSVQMTLSTTPLSPEAQRWASETIRHAMQPGQNLAAGINGPQVAAAGVAGTAAAANQKPGNDGGGVNPNPQQANNKKTGPSKTGDNPQPKHANPQNPQNHENTIKSAQYSNNGQTGTWFEHMTTLANGQKVKHEVVSLNQRPGQKGAPQASHGVDLSRGNANNAATSLVPKGAHGKQYASIIPPINFPQAAPKPAATLASSGFTHTGTRGVGPSSPIFSTLG